MARSLQLSLPERPTWGGRRRGAGRKLTPGHRPGVPHRRRALPIPTRPTHVTLRARPGLRSLRAPNVFHSVRAALVLASRANFRIVQFSVQDDHVHLIVEADGASAFVRGIRGLTIRIARGVNCALGRRGAVWGDRFHSRALTTPQAVRHALVYVLMNRRKHQSGDGTLDPCSSAPWFDGWRSPVPRPLAPSPVPRARTWLANLGWRRHGLIGPEERPRPSLHSPRTRAHRREA